MLLPEIRHAKVIAIVRILCFIRFEFFNSVFLIFECIPIKGIFCLRYAKIVFLWVKILILNG